MSIRHGYKWCVVSLNWCQWAPTKRAHYPRVVETYRTLYGARMAARVWGGWVERIKPWAE